MADLADGLHVIVKRDCPTCRLVEPVLAALAAQDGALTVYCQDDPDFPAGFDEVVDDRGLRHSYGLDIEIVPTVIRVDFASIRVS